MFTFIYGPMSLHAPHGCQVPWPKIPSNSLPKLWAASISNLILIQPTTHQMFSTMSSFPVLCYFSLYCWKGYLLLQGFLNYFFYFILFCFILLLIHNLSTDLAVLKLATLHILGWSWIPRFTCLPSTRIKSTSHYAPCFLQDYNRSKRRMI